MSAESLLEEIYEATEQKKDRELTSSLQTALFEIDKTMTNIKNTSISSTSEIVDSLLDIRSQLSIALAIIITSKTTVRPDQGE